MQVPYLLSDGITSPPSLKAYYTEQLVLLPFTFHSNQYNMTTPSCDVEANFFQFASFSQGYKVTVCDRIPAAASERSLGAGWASSVRHMGKHIAAGCTRKQI